MSAATQTAPREMKDSGVEWIGAIPKEWKVTKIGSLYDERSVKVSDKEYRPLSVSKMGIVPQLESAAKTDNGDQRKLIRKGDFVINSRSDRRGACGISDYDGSCSLINIVLCPREEVNNAYFSYVFRSELFADEFYRWGNGIVDDLWSTKWSSMKRINIPLPSLVIQQHIADYLDRKCGQINAIIEKQKLVIEKLKAYKLSVITEAVTKGLDPNVKMKDSGVEWIGEVPADWRVAKLKHVCNLQTGSTPSTSHAEWFDGELFWYTPSDFLDSYYLQSSSRTLSKRAADDGVAVMVPQDSVMIVGIGATAGKIGYAQMVCSCNQQVTALIPSNVFPKYLMYWMIANTKFLRETALFTTLPILNNQTIGRYLYIGPATIFEQREIASYLDGKCVAIDSAIAKKENLITKLTAYKKSLIYELVTGKQAV